MHRAPRPLISGHPCPSRTRDPVPELEGAAPTTGTAGTPHLWSRWVALKETRRDTRARRPGPEAAALMVLQARVPSSASRPRPAARLRKWGEGGGPSLRGCAVRTAPGRSALCFTLRLGSLCRPGGRNRRFLLSQSLGRASAQRTGSALERSNKVGGVLVYFIFTSAQ